MSEEEYFNILSDIAIGLTCGIIKDTTPSALYSTLNTLLTATIMAENRDVTDGLLREIRIQSVVHEGLIVCVCILVCRCHFRNSVWSLHAE